MFDPNPNVPKWLRRINNLLYFKRMIEMYGMGVKDPYRYIKHLSGIPAREKIDYIGFWYREHNSYVDKYNALKFWFMPVKEKFYDEKYEISSK